MSWKIDDGKKGAEKSVPKFKDDDPDFDLSEIEEELADPRELKAKLEKQKEDEEAEQFQRALDEI